MRARRAGPARWSEGGGDRRQFLRLSGGCLLAVGASSLLAACDPDALRTAVDANGLRLPVGDWPGGVPGFTSRVVARSGEEVGSTGYVWHVRPDGGACFAHPSGGWVYVSNSEFWPGGVSAIRFGPGGDILDAYSILTGTGQNCSGGTTPWGTWLSCEELQMGRVWECDPFGAAAAVDLPALGRFRHEACAVDPTTGIIYMTEDQPDGALYRFVPATAGDLSAGTLQILVEYFGAIGWVPVPDPSASSEPTRYQISIAKPFDRGEGAAWADGLLLFATTGDHSVWSYDPVTNVLDRFYDRDTSPTGDLSSPDNVAALGPVGYVAEDRGDYQVVLVRPGCADTFPVVQLVTSVKTEITGVAFSPDGTRMYFNSQEGDDHSGGAGITYEVTGPWSLFTDPDPGGCST